MEARTLYIVICCQSRNIDWKKEKPVKIKRVPEVSNKRYVSPFDDFFEDFERLFRDPVGSFGIPSVWHSQGLSPSVNVSETNNEIKIQAELPGMDEKDINVTIDNGVLSLRGEKKHECRDAKAHRTECSYGVFERTFHLPEYAEAETAKAKYNNGVLTIDIRKNKKKDSTRSIPISVA